MILSVTEYAKRRKVTPSAILMAMKRGRKLPGIHKVEFTGRKYLLYTNLKYDIQ